MKKVLYIPLLMAALTTNAATFTVSNTNDAGAGSLRQAITDANGTGGADVIDFTLDGQINLGSNLPNITEEVVIDGYTAPGYTLGNPTIVIVGSGGDIFHVSTTGNNSVIRGFSFRGGEDCVEVEGASGVIISGCWVGLNASGTGLGGAIPSTGFKLSNGANNNIVGGTTTEDRNVIFNTALHGVRIESGSNNNFIQGNYIGLAKNGVTVGENITGIIINNSDDNTVGGTVISARNVVCGSINDGIRVEENSNGTIVKANFIGIVATGNSAPGNTLHGLLFINNSNNGLVGGVTVAERNYSGGNGQNGLSVNTSSGLTFINNYSGTDTTGSLDFGNGWSGLSFYASNNSSAADNILSGNNNEGIWIGDCNTLIFTGNLIGINSNGNASIPNNQQGIAVNNSTNVTIGGTSSGDGNVISGNSNQGIRMENSPGVVVKGNIVGLSADGLTGVGNGDHGIEIKSNSDGTIIGGPTSFERNIISGNAKTGIEAEANSLIIENNYIGTDISGTGYIGNTDNGVRLLNRTGHSVINNIISGNGNRGISMENADNTSASGNVISDNVSSGVYIFSSSTGNTFTNNTFERNENGVFIQDANSNGNLISQNSFSCNSTKAINLNGTNEVGVGNSNKPTPTINNLSPIGNLNGTSGANDQIEIYTPGTCNTIGTCEGGDQMQGFVYVTTVVADGSGTWSYPSTMSAQNYTVTATTTTLNNTSEFAICSCSDPTYTINEIDPSNCDVTDGALEIVGAGAAAVVSGGSYSVTYTNNLGATVGPVLYTADTDNKITIENLVPGSYSDIMVSTASCETEDVGPYTLVGEAFDPGVLAIAQTTVCSDDGVYLELVGGNGIIITWMDSSASMGWENVSPGLSTASANHFVELNSLESPITYKGFVIDGSCSGYTNEVAVQVDSCLPDPVLWIPSGFSPNNDGINDGWQIKDIERFSNYKIEVYNRWGSLVFESGAPYTPWNGTSDGKELPAATYYYVVELNDTNESFAGAVSIVP